MKNGGKCIGIYVKPKKEYVKVLKSGIINNNSCKSFGAV